MTVNVETFLQFWSAHNTQIITVLIGLILVTVVYLAFRSFFGQDAGAASLSGGAHAPSLDTAELEKTLQKILDNQSAAPKSAGAPAAAASLPEEVSLGGGEAATPAAAASAVAELAQLKEQVASRDQQIEELKKQTASSTVLGGSSEEEKKELQDKIKDLEARLAEYEIISEDIADLSFYKEENAKLQKDLEALRASQAGAPAASSEVPGADVSIEAVPPAPADAAPIDDLLATITPEPVAPSPAPAAPAASTEVTAASLTEAAPTPPAVPTAEESQLMNQFENFVKKG